MGSTCTVTSTQTYIVTNSIPTHTQAKNIKWPVACSNAEQRGQYDMQHATYLEFYCVLGSLISLLQQWLVVEGYNVLYIICCDLLFFLFFFLWRTRPVSLSNRPQQKCEFLWKFSCCDQSICQNERQLFCFVIQKKIAEGRRGVWGVGAAGTSQFCKWNMHFLECDVSVVAYLARTCVPFLRTQK